MKKLLVSIVALMTAQVFANPCGDVMYSLQYENGGQYTVYSSTLLSKEIFARNFQVNDVVGNVAYITATDSEGQKIDSNFSFKPIDGTCYFSSNGDEQDFWLKAPGYFAPLRGELESGTRITLE